MAEQKRPAALEGASRAGWEARGEAVSDPENMLGARTTQEARNVAAEGWQMRGDASGMSWPVVRVLTTVCQWGFQLWVLECPYCGGDHIHDGGALPTIHTQAFAVTRVSHCHFGDYYLEPSLTACFGEGASRDREARAAMARMAQLGYRTSERIYKPPPPRSLIRLILRHRPAW